MAKSWKPTLLKVRSYLWGSDPKEAALLMKLDFTILPYFSLMWFLFGLSISSFSAAYISGMKKDLNFQGKDFNYLHTTFLITYAVFQIPATALLTVVKPRYVFVSANVTWAILLLITFRMDHVWQMIMLHGFEGALSAISNTGAHFIYGSWYKKNELGKRAAAFVCFGHLGNMSAGWIEAGLIETFLGKGGLPAWRWIFIIVAVITIPIAVFGWFFIPDLPAHRNAWYLSPEEREYADTRMGELRKQSWDKSVINRVLLSWQFWLLPILFTFLTLSIQMTLNNVFQLWLKAKHYTLSQQNNYPTAVFGASIPATIIYCVISDKIQSRWQCSLVVGITMVIGSAILVADPGTGAHFFAFYFIGTAYAAQALWYSWTADVTSHDFQLRAMTTGFMTSFEMAFATWWPLIFYPVTDAPNYEKGYKASVATGACIIPMVLAVAYFERRGNRNGTLGRVFEPEQDADTKSSEKEPENGISKVASKASV